MKSSLRSMRNSSGSDAGVRPLRRAWIIPSIVALLVMAGSAEGQTATIPEPPRDRIAQACDAPDFRHFDFWLGSWSVAGRGIEPHAENHITREAQGCFIREQYHTAQGYTGSSINWYDQATESWHQTWIDNGGLVLHLEGGLEEPERMVLSGSRLAADGTEVIDRITWVAEADGTVNQIWDSSTDGGETWSNAFDGIYRRIPGAP